MISKRHLLDRPPEEDYIEEWTSLLASRKEDEDKKEISVVIFRLGSEWLALTTVTFAEVAQERPIHRIPHRSSRLLLGIVNLRGQLTLCVDMKNILEIEEEKLPVKKEGKIYKRMVAIQKGKNRWIFPVDEVYGVYHCDINRVENVPVTAAKSKVNYMKGIIEWNHHRVGYLDDELLFLNLDRSVL